MKLQTGRWVATAAMAATLVACGGGGGSSSPTGPSNGSAARTWVTGAVDGFGSVIVNGVHYETGSSSVTIEGRSGTEGELEVGDVVRIEAERDSSGRMQARSIDQDRLVQGTVQSVDVAAGTLVVAGQLIIVDDETTFDDSIPGMSLAGIAVGDRVEVHGFAGADGARATRIEMADAGDTEVETTGVVSSLDAAARRFSIGALRIDYSTAELDGFPASGPADGDLVEVEGRSVLADGTLVATEVHREDGERHGDAGDESEIEGLVTRFVSATDFDVAGQAVTTRSSTVYVGGTAADLALNVKVEVEGSYDASGTLVAEKVAFKRHSSVRLSGPVSAVDVAAGTVTALGVTLVVNADTRVEDKEGDDRFFDLGDVRVGDWVEAAGYPDPANTARVIATRFERDEPEDEVELRGVATDVAQPSLRVAGVPVATTPGTEFEDEDVRISADAFFAAASGQVVEVDGSWDGTTITADKAEIEREDDGSSSSAPANP